MHINLPVCCYKIVCLVHHSTDEQFYFRDQMLLLSSMKLGFYREALIGDYVLTERKTVTILLASFRRTSLLKLGDSGMKIF